MHKISFSAGLALVMLMGSPTAGTEQLVSEAIPFHENAGCLEGPMAQFGGYIGNWRIEDSRLQDDGLTWEKGAGARWDFVCLGNGVAIQDFWMPNEGGVGTNLRTYN